MGQAGTGAEYVEVRVTAGSRDEADRLAAAVVTHRLAACAQVVGPITSTYRWNGAVERSDEWLLLMKTTLERFDDLAAHVRRLHSYDVPEIAAVPLTAGTDAYLRWIREETSR
ncbi:divalent-cation tolerance protein CutA [Nonomuraea pusilla]|uniref:Divalent cation tolerance protein n=1 Tax=Nonomuraea pusilla TaxID=46177 RepID=A0A1H7ZMG2_9ACTN|nr:divalent-cation tolerance protein CutA [Nonomuraea pusilla]SEM58728.1 divalent cation tolerance protein [Nonomuraea pusilla]